MGGCFSVSLSCDEVLKDVSQLSCFQASYIHSLEENLSAMRRDMEELKERKTELLRRVEKEEDTRGHQRLAEVKVWLINVDNISRQVSYLLSHRTAKLEMVSLMLKEINDLKSKGVFQVVSEPAPTATTTRRLRHSIVGRETMLKRALNTLMGDGLGIMGLYGVGGVGKTTILQEINNKISTSFDFVIYVVVSQHLLVEKIQEEIGKKLGFDGEEWNQKEESTKATDIHNFMKKKRFVLLLDDVWTKVDFTKIGVPFPTKENKCKIAFTTRSRELCVQMGVDDPIQVQSLAENDAWDLLQMKLGVDTSAEIRELGRKVAERCHGSPLALNVLGETMSHKTTVKEWNDALDVLTSESSGKEDEILPILKYSYDNLRLGRLKSCIQYCALFPPGFTLSKDDLIECWQSEGFIGGYDQGYQVIAELVRSCLLMEVDDNDKFVKMHNVVREMALWVASYSGKQKERFIVKTGVGLSEVPKVEDWSTVRKMSLMNNEIEEIKGSPMCYQLTTLFLQQNHNLVRISGEFFRYMSSLVVLNMSFNELKVLPEQISALFSLQYLNLSRTKIERLPDALGKLKRLKHLDLEMTERLKSIDGIFDVPEKLENSDIGISIDAPSLVVLRLLNSKFSLDVNTIEELKCLKALESLNVDISSSSALEQLSDNHLAYCIEEVCIRDLEEEAYKTLVLPTMERLRKLIIRSCEIREIEIGKTSCDIFLTRARLNNLSSVIITGCNGIKDLTWLLFVRNLTHLKLQCLEKVEEIISEEKAASSITDEQKVRGMNEPFQKLERLELSNLPKLKSICLIPLMFLCLKKIEVERCPKLRKLPLNSESCIGGEEVVINYRDDQWLESVQWQDKATKYRFLPCCEKLMPSYL